MSVKRCKIGGASRGALNGTGWAGEYETFSDLETAIPPTGSGAKYLVLRPQGIPLWNRKPAGLYYDDPMTSTYKALGMRVEVFNDETFMVYDDADTTKNFRFDNSGLTTATTRVYNPPDRDGTLALIEDVTYSQTINVQAGKDTIPGYQYPTYADAVTYANSQSPSYFNIIEIVIHGTQTIASPVLHPYVHVRSSFLTGLVTVGNWTTTGAGGFMSHLIQGISTGGIDPGAGVTVHAWDMILNDQETTSGTGTLWLKRTNMYDGDNNANISTITLILEATSQAAVTNVGDVFMYGESYLTVNGTSAGFLQAYLGGQIYLDNAVTVAGGFLYNSEVYGVNFGALALLDIDLGGTSLSGSLLKRLITSTGYSALLALRTMTLSADMEAVDTTFHDVDIDPDGNTLKTTGCQRGLGTENFDINQNGIWQNVGDIFDSRGTGYQSNDLEGIIKETIPRTQTGMVVKQNDNSDAGTWTTITNALLDDGAGAQAMFGGTALNQAFYVGGDNPFNAIGYQISTIIDLGAGSVTIQYWNGASWTNLNFMESNSKTKISNADVPFEDLGFMRMRNNEPQDWATRDLDGDVKYWMRVIVTGAITTVPVLEFVALFGDGAYDGEYFGTFQPRHLENIYEFQDVSGRTVRNATVDAGPNTALVKQNANFANGAYDGMGFIVEKPLGINTAFDLELFLTYNGSNNNTNDWESQTVLCKVKPEDTADGTLAELSDVSLHALDGDADVIKIMEATFDIQDLEGGDTMQISISRDARGSNLNDLYTGAIQCRVVSLLFRRWF